MQQFTRNFRIKNLDDFKIDEAETHLGRAGLLIVKEKGMTIRYIMNKCLVMFLREWKVNFVEYESNIVAKVKVNNWSISEWLSN